MTSIEFIHLSDLPDNIVFNKVAIIPYIIDQKDDEDFAYALMVVSSGYPTLVTFESKIKQDQKIENVLSNTVYEKTYKSLHISPEDILKDGWILYDKENCFTGIIFLCIDANLKDLCINFRKRSISANKKQEITHILWLPQTKFIYIIRNTTFLDNDGIRRENPSGNVPLDSLLSSLYDIKEGEIPIGPVYNKNATVPAYLSKYPEMEPFLRNFLSDAYEEDVDFFFTF